MIMVKTIKHGLPAWSEQNIDFTPVNALITMFLSYKNRSFDWHCKVIHWFLYDRSFDHGLVIPMKHNWQL